MSKLGQLHIMFKIGIQAKQKSLRKHSLSLSMHKNRQKKSNNFHEYKLWNNFCISYFILILLMNPYYENRQNIAPRKLHRQLHTKQRQKLASVHRDKPVDWANPQNRIKYMNLPPKRLDMQVEKQRNELLMNSGRISGDSPDWWKSTSKYFQRSQMPRIHNTIDLHGVSSDEKSFDVFNRKRDSYMTIKNARQESLYQNRSALYDNDYGSQSSRVSESRSSNLSFSLRNNKSQISPKVGSLETRDYTIRKPALKIGSNNYVDTYSVF